MTLQLSFGKEFMFLESVLCVEYERNKMKSENYPEISRRRKTGEGGPVNIRTSS